MLETLTPRERWTLVIALALACAGGVFVWLNYPRAFPEAHVTFEVNRTTSRPVAEAFLSRHAPRAATAVAGRMHAALFRVDDDAKTYLERVLGLERMGALVASRQVRLWAWSHRYFRPLDKEEVRVQVSPEGDVTGFAHLVPEASPGASLDEAAARSVAEHWLASAFGMNVAGLTFIESQREDRPARRDWAFTFERAGWRAGDATYRIEVKVLGDEPAGYREYLKVPDAWTQGYQRLRSANDTTALVAALGIVLTVLAAIFVLVREGRRGNVRWRLVLSLSSVAFVLVLAMSLNNLPIATYGFDTTGTYGAFLARQLLAGLGSAGGQALLILILVAAGEPLYRARFPQRLRLSALFERAGWRSKRFAFGLMLGYCLAVLFIAYQVAFYLIGNRFGAWNPADVPFDNLLNTSFPWLAVLFMGFYPAVSEEFMSRIFSIPLVERLSRSRLAAVIVPALIWGFAHANYPAQPFYIRGVEVSIAGLAVGIVLYRFGALPCLVWHYVVDAGYTSILMVRSGNPYFVATAIAGTGALLVPALVTVIGAWRRGGFVVDEQVCNAADPAPPEPPRPVAPPVAPIAVAPRRRLAVIAGLATLVAVAVVWRAPDPLGGIGVRSSPAAIRAAAERFLQGRGIEPAKWRLVVTSAGDLAGENARRYLLEHGGTAAVASFVGTIPQWNVRVFRPEDREEWQLQLDDASREVVRFQHILPEERPGASLAPEQARALAEAAMRAAGMDPGALVFKEAKSEKRPARLDYDFTWKDPARSVADAEYLVTMRIQGDAVDGQTRRLKLPEAWERARAHRSLLAYLLVAAKVAVVALLLVHGLLTLYRALRSGTLPWAKVLTASAFAAALIAAGTFVSSPLAWSSYSTAWPESAFRISLVIGLTISILMAGLAVVLIMGVLVACFPAAAGVTVPRVRRPVATETVLALVTLSAAAVAYPAAVSWVRVFHPTWFADLPVSLSEALATALPPVAAFGGGLFAGIALLGAVGLIAHVWTRLRRRWLRSALVAGVVLLALPGGSGHSAAEFAVGVSRAVLVVAVAGALLRFVVGANFAGYLTATVWLSALWSAAPLLAQPGVVYRRESWLTLGVVAIAILAWLYRAARTGPTADAGPASTGADRPVGS